MEDARDGEVETARPRARGASRILRPGDLDAGRLESSGSVNVGYSWHIDPNDIEFANITMEVCDGKPPDVEAQLITSDRFCPWTARGVATDEVR